MFLPLLNHCPNRVVECWDHLDAKYDHDLVYEELLYYEDYYDGSESISITLEDIFFNLVYAFNTFVAKPEGKAWVVRNDSLMLLEDANVYWWLVRVLKTGVIGYIPAENIEVSLQNPSRDQRMVDG